MRLVENSVITIYVNNKYKYIDVNNAENIDNKIYNDIVTKMKSLLFHKIGGFIVTGTDNIIISKYLGLVKVGLYSNYYLIIDSVSRLFGQTIKSITASVGHLLVENDYKKNYDIFKKIRFVNFWVATFAGSSILIIIKPFITLWLGEKYLLSIYTLIVLVLNFYQSNMRNSFITFKDAAGIYYEDRFVPILESITNIIVSIILVNLIDLPGVFIGTIISSLWLWCYSYPKFIYKKLFKRQYIDYFKETIGYTAIFIIIISICYYISSLLIVSDILLQFIINVIISLLIPNIIIILLFRKKEEYKYFKNMILKILKRGQNEK